MRLILAVVILGMSGCTGTTGAPTPIDLTGTTANSAVQQACATAVASASALQSSLDEASQAQTDGTSRAEYFEDTISASTGDIRFDQLTCFIAVLDQVYAAP